MEGDSRERTGRAAQLRGSARVQKRELDGALESASGPKPAPLDPRVRRARTALRNTYVTLLLTCTFDRSAVNVESLLWAETTYNEIAIFRAMLGKIEGECGAKRTNAYRRALRDLRRFLAEEQAFWAQLCGRIVRMFSLDEARDVLAGLGIVMGEEGQSRLDAPDLSFERDYAVQTQAERNALAADADNRVRLTMLAARALTYCGDVVRYREQYASPALLQGKGTSDVPVTVPNYDAAAAFYHAATSLFPASGSPENQLAVLATYQGDRFGALFHYMNAFVAPQPFENARFNIRRIVSQSLPKWQRSSVRISVLGEWKHAALASAAGASTCVPMYRMPLSGAEWLVLLVDLHSLLACGTECVFANRLDCAAALDNVLRDTALSLAIDSLRAVDLLRAVVVGIRAESMPRNGAELGDAVKPVLAAGTPSAAAAARAPEVCRLMRLCHVLGLVTALSAICRHAISTNAPQRAIPALRLALKWVRHELAHVYACSSAASQLGDANVGADVSAATDPDARFYAIVHDLPGRFSTFWSAYSALVDALSQAYPGVSSAPVGMPEDTLLASAGVPQLALGPDTDMARVGDILADADAVRTSTSSLSTAGDEDDPVESAMRAFESQREEQPVRTNAGDLLEQVLHGAALAPAHSAPAAPAAPSWPPSTSWTQNQWPAWQSQPPLLFGAGAQSSIWGAPSGWPHTG